MEIKPPEFSRCEACNAELAPLKMDAPLYCISCIEEMTQLGMTPKQYRKHSKNTHNPKSFSST